MAQPERRLMRGYSKAGPPVRPIPAGMFKCGCCGKTLPEMAKQDGLPPVWDRCQECHRRAQNDERNPWKTPLGH